MQANWKFELAVLNDVWLKPARSLLQPKATKPDSSSIFRLFSTSSLAIFGDKNYKEPR